jgi:hypothetical protein
MQSLYTVASVGALLAGSAVARLALANAQGALVAAANAR